MLPLAARFDDGVMRAPPSLSQSALPRFEREVGERLRRWCDTDAGDGRSPLLQPRRMPELARPLAVAALIGGPSESIASAVAAFALVLDGSDRLQRLGIAGGLLFRARVKLADCCWWRVRRPGDPWDSGYLRHDPQAIARLDAFLPRRATLLVAQDMAAPSLRKAVVTLRHRQGLFVHPVRLLVIGDTLAPGLEPVEVIQLPGAGD